MKNIIKIVSLTVMTILLYLFVYTRNRTLFFAVMVFVIFNIVKDYLKTKEDKNKDENAKL